MEKNAFGIGGLNVKIRHSIRTKLILVISLLVILLMSVTATFLVKQKQNELASDIFTNSISFAELASDDFVKNYETYYLNDSFVEFNRFVKTYMKKHQDIGGVKFVLFAGDVKYDSSSDLYQEYVGKERIVDSQVLERVQAPFPSVNSLIDNRVIFLEKSDSGKYLETDIAGKKVNGLSDGEKVEELVYPVNEKYSLIFSISYDLLESRIARTYLQIGMLILAGTFIGCICSIFLALKLSAPIKTLKEGVEQIAKGRFDHRISVKSNDELGLLSDAFNKMSNDLKKALRAMAYKERVGKELELAKEIQNSLVPSKVPEIAGLDIMASVKPAEEIGGDCYDFLKVNDEKTIMYLGDVTGHGVPSGLLVSVANALIYDYSTRADIKTIMCGTNRVLHAKSRPNMFITMVMLEWNSALSTMNFVSAGHEKILHYKAKTKKIDELESGGIALGMVPDTTNLLKINNVDLKTNDFLIIYSDGIPEAWSKKKEQYGLMRLRSTCLDIISHSDKSPTAAFVHNKIIENVTGFMNGYPQADDITLMVIKKV